MRGRLSRRPLPVDRGHIGVAVAGRRFDGCEARELVGGQLDAVSSCVFLEPRDALCTGDRGNVVSLGEEPGERDLGRCRADLLRDSLDLVDDPQVVLEVALGEAWVVSTEVAGVELVPRTEAAGQEAAAEGE